MTEREFQPSRGSEYEGRKRTPEEIEAEIDETRSAISEDIRELGEKLKPEHIKQSAKAAVYDAAGNVRDNAVDMARHAGSVSARFASDNAAPLALIGLGVGWFAWNLRKSRGASWGEERRFGGARTTWRFGDERRGWTETGREYEMGPYYGGPSESVRGFEPGTEGSRYYRGGAERPYERSEGESLSERAQGAIENVRERGHEMAEELRDRAQGLAERGRERIREMGDGHGESTFANVRSRLSDTRQDLGRRASELGRSARDRFSDMQGRTRDYANENPLAVGALAVLLGVGIGMLLPASQRERRLLGPTRDRLFGEARDAAQRVGRVARETAEDVKGKLEPSISH